MYSPVFSLGLEMITQQPESDGIRRVSAQHAIRALGNFRAPYSFSTHLLGQSPACNKLTCWLRPRRQPAYKLAVLVAASEHGHVSGLVRAGARLAETQNWGMA